MLFYCGIFYGNANMKGKNALFNVAGITAQSRDFLSRSCRQNWMMMEKITSDDIYGFSSCIADVSVKTRRPQKPVEVTHRKS